MGNAGYMLLVHTKFKVCNLRVCLAKGLFLSFFGPDMNTGSGAAL